MRVVLGNQPLASFRMITTRYSPFPARFGNTEETGILLAPDEQAFEEFLLGNQIVEADADVFAMRQLEIVKPSLWIWCDDGRVDERCQSHVRCKIWHRT